MGADLEKRNSECSSRRASKLSEQVKATPVMKEEEEDEEEDVGYFSRRTSGLSNRVESVPDIEFTLVAEGTPRSRSEKSSIGEVTPESGSMLRSSGDFFDPAEAKSGSIVDGAADYFDPHPGRQWTGYDGARDSEETLERTQMPQIEQGVVNDSALSASGSTAKVKGTLGGAADYRERDSGERWSDLEGAVKKWDIIQGSPTSGRARSSINDPNMPESDSTVKDSSELSNTAKVESDLDGAEDPLETQLGTGRLGAESAAEFQELMVDELGKRGVRWYECGG